MNVFQVFTLNIFKSILKHSRVFFIKSMLKNSFLKVVAITLVNPYFTSEREFRQELAFLFLSFLVSKLRAESLV